MTYRQVVWGLSNGVFVLTLGGLFWASLGLGLGLRLLGPPAGWTFLFPLLAILNPIVAVGLLIAAVRLRRRATGFRLSEVWAGDLATQEETKHIVRAFRWVGLAQSILIALVGFLSHRFQRPDLAWPAIGLILGVHFLPLARILRAPVYYVTGLASTAVALLALAVLDGAQQTLFLGYGMALTDWLTAAYVVTHVEALAERWSGAADVRALATQ